MPKLAPPDTNSPFYDIPGNKAAAKNTPSAGVIASSVISGLVFIGSVGLVIWHLYRRHVEKNLEEAPLPPQIDGQGSDSAKSVYGRLTNEIPELASPVRSSQAPRYSTLTEPAQLHGDSAFPVGLYSPPLGHELPLEPRGVYEAQSNNRLGMNATMTDIERDPTAYESLPEVPVPPPVGELEVSSSVCGCIDRPKNLLVKIAR
ncbi:uncharacterized protein DFL_003104 [Arthrobotrys flagrans]|uniref:Uncharacterized protein n=1 Tax=Arthrobotrys flagrans TaxID=97331 RepID=A0A437ADR4_ARTFL|nr:hypothetical protein DFL_003104 [Arthrobotrys flagrans]